MHVRHFRYAWYLYYLRFVCLSEVLLSCLDADSLQLRAMVVSLNEFLGLLHLAFVCLLLLVVEQGAAQPELTYDECLGTLMESNVTVFIVDSGLLWLTEKYDPTTGDPGISITVDCVSTPSFAYLTISGIGDVLYLAIFYSCRNMSSDELVSELAAD